MGQKLGSLTRGVFFLIRITNHESGIGLMCFFVPYLRLVPESLPFPASRCGPCRPAPPAGLLIGVVGPKAIAMTRSNRQTPLGLAELPKWHNLPGLAPRTRLP
jgi:hypothetical protein